MRRRRDFRSFDVLPCDGVKSDSCGAEGGHHGAYLDTRRSIGHKWVQMVDGRWSPHSVLGQKGIFCVALVVPGTVWPIGAPENW